MEIRGRLVWRANRSAAPQVAVRFGDGAPRHGRLIDVDAEALRAFAFLCASDPVFDLMTADGRTPVTVLPDDRPGYFTLTAYAPDA